MKAILEFELPMDDPEYRVASHAREFYLVLWDLDQWLRGKLKYDTELTEEQLDCYQRVRDFITEHMADADVSLDMLP